MAQIITENFDKSKVSEIKQKNGQKFELPPPENSEICFGKFTPEFRFPEEKSLFATMTYIYAKRAMFRREKGLNSCHSIWRIKHPRYEQRPWFSG